MTIELKHTDGYKHLLNADVISKCLFAMSLFGVGEIAGSQVMGMVIDKFGAKKAGF